MRPRQRTGKDCAIHSHMAKVAQREYTYIYLTKRVAQQVCGKVKSHKIFVRIRKEL